VQKHRRLQQHASCTRKSFSRRHRVRSSPSSCYRLPVSPQQVAPERHRRLLPLPSYDRVKSQQDERYREEGEDCLIFEHGPSLVLMTCSVTAAATCVSSTWTDSIDHIWPQFCGLAWRLSLSAGRGGRGCGSKEARVLGRRRDDEEARRRRERVEGEEAGQDRRRQ
jgi:hypothetical protein